ncbi:hypothetical protein HSZ48_05665 [Staphylococcus saprophyticus]|uniref:hypothetical protein n=1 Tax=Staphylococcus saprophyticus TaxID=29385 RepID=UPI000A576512|nr:hypothetical protein [Staphylococcus saprophyticus]MBN6203942.1 hypothetical protein [Staphylococcus saprophyticus]QKV11160.1 hypothetical protein HSZ48_05665 [Staphylococcus saprophyticus]
MEQNNVDDKDIKLAIQQNEIARLNDVNINLQVQIEKLYRENKELKESQPE